MRCKRSRRSSRSRGAGRARTRSAARRYTWRSRLDALGRDADVEPTSIFPNYPITHAIHALLGIVGSVLSVYQPVVGAALVLFATVSAFGDLSSAFYVVRRLTGRRASQNVTSKEGGDKPGVVILTAHYDAARTGTVFSRRSVERRATFGKLIRRGFGPFEPFFWSLFLILACTILRLVGFEGTAFTVVQFIPTVVLIASMPLLVDIALSDVVPGANDNASGVATVLRLAERYGGQLENFDVWVVFPGAEEALLARHARVDASAQARARPRATPSSSTSTWPAPGPCAGWRRRDSCSAMRYHPTLVELCEEIGDGRGMMSRNTTDALIARSAGFPAITITSRNALDYAPNWHQMTDTPDRIEPDSLDRTYAFCSALLERLDDSVGPRARVAPRTSRAPRGSPASRGSPPSPVRPPIRIFFTGTSSFLPLSVRGTASIRTISSGTCRGEQRDRTWRRISALTSSVSSPRVTTNSGIQSSMSSTRLSITSGTASTAL